MKFNRWSWGYIPVVIVLGLIWYEFLQSGTLAPPPKPPTAPSSLPAAPLAAASSPAAPVAPPIAQVPPVTPVQPPATTTKPQPPKTAPALVIDDAFLNNPPPISLSVTHATLDGLIDALRQSLGTTSFIQAENPRAYPDRTYTLTVKNAPFWEVFRQLQPQHPVGLTVPYTANTLGLVLNMDAMPVYRFETSGPAALFPVSMVYTRAGSGQAAPGAPAAGLYTFTLFAAADPRLLVTSSLPVELLSATDDAGRDLAAQSVKNGGFPGPGNFWGSTITFPAPEPRAHTATFKCQVRFTIQLPGDLVAVDDITQKAGDIVTVGDRHLRLARCDVRANQLYIQIAPENEPQDIPILCSVMDANGRSMLLPQQPNNTANFPTTDFPAPYRLLFRPATPGRELTFPFELKDIPLP